MVEQLALRDEDVPWAIEHGHCPPGTTRVLVLEDGQWVCEFPDGKADDGPVGDDDGYPAPSVWEAYHDAEDDYPHSTLECPICEDAAQRAEEAKVY